MDWFLAQDKDELLIVVYEYDKEKYRGETVIKIPVNSIIKKVNELSTKRLILTETM